MNQVAPIRKSGKRGSAARLIASGFVFTCLMGFVFHPVSLFACAACYGQSDSAMAKGMNFGIISLLGVVVVVLGGIAGFFVYIAKRSAPSAVPEALTKTTENLTSQ